MSSDATEGSPEERPAADLAAEALRRAEDVAPEADGLTEATAARALALASALSQILIEIAHRLDEYSAFGKRSRQILTSLRRMGIGLAVSLALDIILTVVLGFTAFQAHDTADTNTQLVQELHAAQLTSCANGNTFRADQNTIWRDFIGLITKPAPGEPPAQVMKTDKLARQFLAYVATVNHPVDCAALYGKETP